MRWPGPEFDDIDIDDVIPDHNLFTGTPFHHKGRRMASANDRGRTRAAVSNSPVAVAGVAKLGEERH